MSSFHRKLWGVQSILAGTIGTALLLAMTTRVSADLNNLPSGYSIKLISTGSISQFTSISQLAFKPGDMTHVYAARDGLAKVSRYNYNPVTGALTNDFAVAVVAGGQELIGLGFHGTNLYVTLDFGGSKTIRPGDGRVARFFNPNTNGVYQSRHDFVYGVDKGDHDLDMIKIKGNSLYVGIGAASRNGDPARDSIHTMTIARVVNLNLIISNTNQIGVDFKGPSNYLANAAEFVNTNGTDGQLRYFASGYRNPFGINFDPDGDLWVSSNGNDDPGFFSEDLLYKKVFLGAQGDFPPVAFGFTNYITGTPQAPFVDFGVSPALTGFDFIREGPDAGKVLLGSAGATGTRTLGRDLQLIDPNTGSHVQIYQFATVPPTSLITDVLRDPYGRFLISDYANGKVWLLTPPLPRPVVQTSITNGALLLSWPLTGVEYHLEETVNSKLTNSWQTSSAAIQINSDAIRALIPLTNTARFFRLKK